MRKIIFLIVISLFSFQQCATQTYIDKETLTEIIENKTFTFEAERIVPTSNEAVNAINNNIGASANVLNIAGEGYHLTVEKEKIEMNLPYFGRNYGYVREGNASVNFTSKDFSTKKEVGKKGQTIFTIIPNDIREVESIYMEIFDNGQTYVSFNFRDRQAISYDGYIQKNKIKD